MCPRALFLSEKMCPVVFFEIRCIAHDQVQAFLLGWGKIKRSLDLKSGETGRCSLNNACRGLLFITSGWFREPQFMPKYWSPQNSRQQFWGSTFALGFGLLLAAGAAWMGWQAYEERQLRQGEVAQGRVVEAKRSKNNFHVSYEFRAQGQTWQGQQFGSTISTHTWDELQRTGQASIRYLPLSPSTNAWEPALSSQILKHTVLCIVVSCLSALVIGISGWGLWSSLR